jgi:hypothetical protein
MNLHHRGTLRVEFGREQPGKGRKGHHSRLVAEDAKFSGIGGIDRGKVVPVQDVIVALDPPDSMYPAGFDGIGKRFCDAYHHQEVPVGKPRKSGVEGTKDIRGDAYGRAQGRARKVHVRGTKHQLIESVFHNKSRVGIVFQRTLISPERSK